MKNPTLLLPGFHLQTLRRRPRSAQQILADERERIQKKSLSQLGKCFGKFISSTHLAPTRFGPSSRQRILSKENTFWTFFSQVLDSDSGCQEAVRKLQAYAAMKTMPLPSSSTAAYCKARGRLSEDELASILKDTAERIPFVPEKNHINGRRVVVADGTGVSMPDTDENQNEWPQQTHQKAGCGFPQARICACFCLQTGTLLSHEIGNKKSHELPLLRRQDNTFRDGDIFLGDKGFCSYFDISKLQDSGVDSVITLARRKPIIEAESQAILGKDDLVIEWQKPKRTNASAYSQEEWEALPEKLPMRQIKVTVDQPGFRVSSFYIVTTLLDPAKYPAADIADLYFQRWDVELFFRDIKTTMSMDVLRCKTPSMVRKEILMHLIVYNCIRSLMLESAEKKGIGVRRVSFKAALQALRQWEPNLKQSHLPQQERTRLMALLHDSITDKIIPYRPGRSEPRAVKRRPKPFQLLTSPRHVMRVIPHRGKNHAKQA
jgi:hypothetical protein